MANSEDFCKMNAVEVEDMRKTLELELDFGLIQNILENAPLNIAVTGESGCGKSTFINAFRRLGDEDDDSAPTGVVETTMEPKAYPHPDYPNVIFWDLPGIGTPRFKADQYLAEVKFERYDFFIIVAAGRFRECHVKLASEIKKMKKNFYFLRNKIDDDIKSEKMRRSFNEEKVLEAIRQDCIKGLGQTNAANVFLISCHDLGLYDFNRLLDHIEKDLPNQKRDSLLLAIPAITMKILQKKKKALRTRIWKVALVSGAVAAVPVPGLSFAVNVGILVAEIKRYYKAFNLDDESLQKLAESSGVPVEELKAEMKYAVQNKRIDIGFIVFSLLLSTGSALGVVTLLSLIPAVGSSLAAGMSFGTTYYMLRKCLKELATDGNNVLMKALHGCDK